MKSVFKEYNESFSQTLKIELYYHLGGMNYFTGTNEARGYYLSVTPVTLSKGDGYTSESYTAFTGVKQLVVECKRQSGLAMNKAVNDHKTILPNLINHVVSKNKLTQKQAA